jgi:hypothetical protein
MPEFIVLTEKIVRQVLARSLYIKSTVVDHGVINPNISDNTALVLRSLLLTRLAYTVVKQTSQLASIL